MNVNLKNSTQMNRKNSMNYSSNIYKKWMKNNKWLKKINKISWKSMKINQKKWKISYNNLKLLIKTYNSKSNYF